MKPTPRSSNAGRIKTKPATKGPFSTPRKSSRRRNIEEAVPIVTPVKPNVKVDFGVMAPVPENVKKVYRIINEKTGRIGGNGSGGPIYGELTMRSMQKMVELMKRYTNFNSESTFIDVGSGLGKPNIFVAQDPKVAFSCGIEVEQVRNILGLHNLLHILQEAKTETDIGTNCILKHANILEARTFDPFTHVYMFDIGFPPSLFKELARMFSRSQVSQYLICFHNPRLIVDRYGFDVELLAQTPTKMHGSSESHTGYVYRKRHLYRSGVLPRSLPMLIESEASSFEDDTSSTTVHSVQNEIQQCDPLFQDVWDIVKKGLSDLTDSVSDQIKKDLNCGRPKRVRKQIVR